MNGRQPTLGKGIPAITHPYAEVDAVIIDAATGVSIAMHDGIDFHIVTAKAILS
jgi:hypothetical protein